MKNKGFTLIELLAVIVILAIIALIATPIILGIINNAKEESDERSVELYASAIKNALAKKQLDGSLPISGTGYTSDSLEAILDVEYDGDVDCSVIDITEDGKVTMSGCKVNDGTKEYSYGKQQQGTEVANKICTIANDSTITGTQAGAKYNCKVDPNAPEYTFYVIGTNQDNSVNLILEDNICENGTLDTDGACNVEWGSGTQGPDDLLVYLYNATDTWTNVLIQNPQVSTSGYDELSWTMESTNGVVTITGSAPETTIGTISAPLRARAIYKSEIDEDYRNKGFLVSNMMDSNDGYWTLTFDETNWLLHAHYIMPGTPGVPYLGSAPMYEGGQYYGARPVITISANQI